MLVPPMVQLAAANALLDRGYGRPAQAVEMSGKDSGPIQTEGVSAYDIIVGRLESIAQRLREDEDGDAEQIAEPLN
jgi:hypothetical protein